MSKHHGEWQAQGKDISEKRGHRVDWGQDTVPTKSEGRDKLRAVSELCTTSERARRSGRACREALKFIRRCPPQGHPTTSRQFYAKDDSYPNARIDLEIYGMAFRDEDFNG